MRPVFKQTKAVYNAYSRQYEVYYRKWFSWHFDSCYKYDEDPKDGRYCRTKERAEQMAVERAQAMMGDKIVWISSPKLVK